VPSSPFDAKQLDAKSRACPVDAVDAQPHADYRITRDHGGLVDEHNAEYAKIRDQGERVVIARICYSACTLVHTFEVDRGGAGDWDAHAFPARCCDR
jgi:hypothetical protein